MIRYGLMFCTVLLPLSSLAQTSMWGTGLYGGMQSCPYNVRAGNGAASVDDATKEIQSEISEAQKQLKAKKSEKKKVDREAERAKAEVTKTLSDDSADFIFEHIENSRRCNEYKGYQSPSQESEVQGDQGGEAIANQNLIPVQSFSASEWSQYCDASKAGGVSGAVCGNPRFKQSEGGRSDAASCKKGLSDYRKSYAQSQKLQREIERLENSIARSKEALKDAKQDALEAQRDRMQNGDTEGGICIECMAQGNGYSYQKPQQTDWGSVIGNVALGLGSVYMGYKTNQMITENNANLGWPTNPYSSVGYGYGFGAMATGLSQALGGGSGIYGSVGGGLGSGAFGCAGMNGGSMGMMGSMMGSMMGGYPMSSMGSMMGGMLGMGMMTGMGTMTGMGMVSGYDSSSMQMQMQYQQQLMQMQMQQYQSYMQYQQQYQQQTMAKYQTISSLQQEMYSLMARIQQVQYGYGTTGYVGGTLGTGISGYTYGTNLPYSNTTITPLPSLGTGTTTVIPGSR